MNQRDTIWNLERRRERRRKQRERNLYPWLVVVLMFAILFWLVACPAAL